MRPATGSTCFRPAARSVIISGHEKITSIRELIARQDAEKISLFLVAGDNALYHVRGQQGNTARWTYPLAIRQDVTQVAALRDRHRNTGQLFLVHGNNTLAYLYQDPITTLWRRTEVALSDTGRVLEFNCYTTHLHFEDANRRPPADLALQITASAWTYATINGRTHSLDPDTAVTVQPDFQGNLTIINKVEKLGTPVFHVRSASFTGTLDVNPGFKITEGLKPIQSGADLANATLKNGQKLLPTGADPQTLQNRRAECAAVDAGRREPGAGHAERRGNAVACGQHRSAPERRAAPN